MFKILIMGHAGSGLYGARYRSASKYNNGLCYTQSKSKVFMLNFQSDVTFHHCVNFLIHLFSNAFEQLNICFRHSLLKMTILGMNSTNGGIPSTVLQNSSSNQQNCSTPSNPQMLLTILKIDWHLYTKIDNLIKLLYNQQNIFEKNKKQIIKLTSASRLLRSQLRLLL